MVSTNALIALEIVYYMYYFLFIAYIMIRISIRFRSSNTEKAKSYIKVVDMFFKFFIGILLISMSFPVVFIDLSEPKYKKGIVRVMWIAGFIVLSTIKFDDVRFAIDTIEDIYNKYS
tara:strand:+ start:7187 stop:7537 length:351 start_codon:yes stop_codon:yes gene_type:complete